MKLQSILLTTALVTIISSCGPQANNKSAVSTSTQNTASIFGGVDADATFQQEHGIVGLTLVMQSAFGYGLSTCTGSLIDKKVILTAAHCLMGDATMQVVAVAVSFQPNMQNLQKNFFSLDNAGFAAENVIFVDTVAAHPDFMKDIDPENDPDYGNKNWNDIAVLRLASDAPSQFKFAQLPSNADMASFSTQSKLVLSGYGVSTPIVNKLVIDPKTGKASIVPVKEATPSAGILRRTDDITVTEVKAANMEFVIESSLKGSCHGDSGGPAFLARADGSLFQVGVVSRGTNELGNCNEFVIYTNIIGQSAWITSATQQILAVVIPPAPETEPETEPTPTP